MDEKMNKETCESEKGWAWDGIRGLCQPKQRAGRRRETRYHPKDKTYGVYWEGSVSNGAWVRPDLEAVDPNADPSIGVHAFEKMLFATDGPIIRGGAPNQVLIDRLVEQFPSHAEWTPGQVAAFGAARKIIEEARTSTTTTPIFAVISDLGSSFEDSSSILREAGVVETLFDFEWTDPTSDGISNE